MGADGQLIYRFDSMASAVGSIDAAIGRMRGTLSQLEGDLRPLETEAWTSEAQMAYKIRKDRWNGAANHIALLLGQVKVSLEAAAQRMQSTDRRAAGYFPS